MRTGHHPAAAVVAPPEIVVASVVLPVGSVDAHLDTQLAALRDQTYPGSWELIVVLDASGAETRLDEALVRSAATIGTTVVQTGAGRGAPHARNVGATAARGTYLLFCDADDEVAPTWLETMVVALEEHDVVGGALDERKLAMKGQEHWRPPATPDDLPSLLGWPYAVSANMGVRRDLFEEVGGFDETLVRGEDIALSWELTRHGQTLAYVATAVVY
jgi:GT2 family glycosyltransferase